MAQGQIGIPGGETFTPLPTYAGWQQSVRNWTPDIPAMKERISAVTGKAVADITDEDVAGRMMDEMLEQTNARRVLSPIWENYLRRRGQAANVAGMWNLGQLAKGVRTGEYKLDEGGAEGLPSYIRGLAQGDTTQTTARLLPSNIQRDVGNVSALARARGVPTDQTTAFDSLTKDIPLQRQMALAAANSMGYSGMWAKYLAQRLEDLYNQWAYMPEGDTKSPTYLEHVYNQLQPAGLWY